MTKYSFTVLHHTGTVVPVDFIGLYRSSTTTRDQDLVSRLKQMLIDDRISIICGDFNIRYKTDSQHFLVCEIMKMNFVQLIDHPTHKDGGISDHLYLYRPSCYNEIIISWELFSPFYSDHFGISIIINKENNPFLRMLTTVPYDLIINENNGSKQSNPKNQTPKDNSKRKSCSSPHAVPK